MKCIKMVETTTYLNESGALEVFGPPGKVFTVGDDIADGLIDGGFALDQTTLEDDETELY